MVRRWIGLTATSGAVLALCINGFVIADEKAPAQKPKPAAAAEKTGDKAAEKPAAEKKPVDPFAVPDGSDSKVLEQFLQRLMNAPPKSLKPEVILDHLNKLEKVGKESDGTATGLDVV